MEICDRNLKKDLSFRLKQWVQVKYGNIYSLLIGQLNNGKFSINDVGR